MKLSNAGNSSLTVKSRESNASSSTSIWALPEPSPKSSPPPQPCKGGVDQTSDKTNVHGQPSTTTTGAECSLAAPIPSEATTFSPPAWAEARAGDGLNPAIEGLSDHVAQMPLVHDDLFPVSAPMLPSDLAEYASRAGITYPTESGPDLYRVAMYVPKVRREAFEEALGDAITAYYEEIVQQGHEPSDPIAVDVLTQFLLPGLVTSAQLFEAYNRAWQSGQGRAFLAALQERSIPATEILNAWLAGNRSHKTIFIDGMTASA